MTSWPAGGQFGVARSVLRGDAKASPSFLTLLLRHRDTSALRSGRTHQAASNRSIERPSRSAGNMEAARPQRQLAYSHSGGNRSASKSLTHRHISLLPNRSALSGIPMRRPRLVKLQAMPAWLTLLIVMMLMSSSGSAQPAPQAQRQQAVCSLELSGAYPPDTLEATVASAELHCTSTSPVSIGINSTYLGKHMSQFRGVQVISDLACQQQAQGWWTSSGGTRKSLLAMLYFCGDYDITLLQPRVLNMTLKQNSSDWFSAVLAFGGSTVATIRQGSFVGNSAGSTIVAFQTATLQVEDHSVFDHNSGLTGTGIKATDEASLVVRDVSFSHNTATEGGALGCFQNASVNIDSCLFYNNTASIWGGAVDIGCTSGQQATISNTTFHGNSADMGGAANLQVNTTISVESSSFTANNAFMGGAIHLDTSSAITATGCTFHMNNASSGGGLYCDGCSVQAGRLSFTRNNAVDFGGGLCATDQAQVTVNNTTFQANSAAYGGAVELQVNTTISIENSSFTANHASTSGGGIDLDSDSAVTATECTFHLNNASVGGGLHCARGSVHAHKLLFTHNNAVNGGGGLGASGQAQIFISHNSSFVDNSANTGGAIFIATGSANLTLSNSSLLNNSADNDGGAMYLGDLSVALVTAGSTISGNYATASGGGIYAFGKSLITINGDTKVQANAANSGGGAWVTDFAQVIMEGISVSGNQGTISGGGLVFYSNARGNLTGCKVTLNEAGGDGGGLISLDQTVLTLKDCLVANNIANGSGGGVWIDGKAQLVLLGDTSVTSNHADFGWGGGVSLQSGGFDLGQVTRAVHNNFGQYDVNVQSKVTSLTLVGNTSTYDFANLLGKGDGLFPVTLNVSGYYGLPCQYVRAQAVLQGTFLGLNHSDEHGLVHLGLRIARPSGVYVISLSSSDAPGLQAANLTLPVRSCIRGEVTPSPDACQPCQQGFFSFDPSQKVCSACPGNANCSGGDVITPLPGYWRSSTDSVQINRCPNPIACNSAGDSALLACAANRVCGTSTTYKDLQCAPGYYGNVCGLCLPGTGATKLFVCRGCNGSGSIIALYVIAAVVLLCLIELMCHLNRKQDAAASHSDDPSWQSKVPAAQLLRPLLLYSQYMLVVSSMPVEWPASIGYPLKVFAWVWSPASPETLSIDCLLPRGTHLPISIQKVLFYVCTPLVILGLLLLAKMAQVQYLRVKKKHVAMQVKDLLHSSALVAVFFFYPSILRNLFSMFACIPLDQPAAAPYTPAAIGSYWVMDMNQQCFTGYHRAWSLGFGLPCALIVCLGLPLGVLLLMLNKRAYLVEPTTRQHYGFLYMSYRQPMFCWECVVMTQTMVLVAVSVFGVNLGVVYQVIVMNAALILMVILLLIFKPYAYHQAGKVMLQAVFCLLLTSYTALTFLQLGSIQPSPEYGVIMGCVVLLVNLVFVVSVVWQMIRLVNWKEVWNTVERICSKLKCSHSCISGLAGIGARHGSKQQALVAMALFPEQHANLAPTSTV